MKKIYASSFKTGIHAVNFYIAILLKAVPGVLFLLLYANAGIAQTQTFTASGTFTVPAGVTTVSVQCWGAGGGGSNVSNNIVGGGGGGGAYAGSTVTVVPGNSYNVVIGKGAMQVYGVQILHLINICCSSRWSICCLKFFYRCYRWYSCCFGWNYTLCRWKWCYRKWFKCRRWWWWRRFNRNR